MSRLARLVIHWPRTVGALLIGITLVAVGGVRYLTLDSASSHLFLRQSAAYTVYQQFLTAFGSDESLLVAVHTPARSLVEPEGLAVIKQLTRELSNLPQVASVVSLSNAPDMTRLAITPFGIAIPRLLESDSLSPVQQQMLPQNTLLMGTLLARDRHTAGILVVPNDTIADPNERDAWLVEVRQIAGRYAAPGRQTYVAGTPLERYDVSRYLERDQRLLIPLVFAILVGMTWWLYGVKRLALIPLTCVLLSLLWTMGTVGFLGTPLNVVTSLLPPVIMVVSISVAIHVMNQFLDEQSRGRRGATAVYQALCHVGTACCLTSLTTMLGFFSLLASPVPAVREFALFAGIGVGLSFVVSITCAPIMLLRIGEIEPERFRHLKDGWIEQLLDRLVRWVASHRWKVILGSVATMLALLPGAAYLTEGTDIIRALKPKAPLRVSSEFIDGHLTGVHALEVVVKTPDPASLTTPRAIRQVLEFTRWLRAQPGVTAVYGPWEALRDAPEAIVADDTHLTTLAALLPVAFPLDAWINIPSQRLRLSVRVKAMRSDQFLALAETVARQAAAARLQVQLTGSNYLLAQMSRTLVQTQTQTFGLATVLVLGSIALALRSWKLGCIAALPNLLPPMLLFGLMGWCGISLSTATTMIASVVLGLIVDDTIHLLHRYTRERAAGYMPHAAVERSLRSTGRALIATTCILTLGFWAGVLGSFQPTIHFSFLTGLTMLIALGVELLMTPAVLLVWDAPQDRNNGRKGLCQHRVYKP